ncbi:hypothetical protein LSH36_1155g00002 [Paralvinella palmiformis]|uniref:Uncharacterized protein n=1 Tax=Paralvinella palmiformis TaxID=53620 RepID=A0AAD9IUW0_9ANNE|nr:hypothetical protein LSH36_1155g00002 [Paralvinella palmiformis]
MFTLLHYHDLFPPVSYAAYLHEDDDAVDGHDNGFTNTRLITSRRRPYSVDESDKFTIARQKLEKKNNIIVASAVQISQLEQRLKIGCFELKCLGNDASMVVFYTGFSSPKNPHWLLQMGGTNSPE